MEITEQDNRAFDLLTRQRRNLLGSSLLLFFAKYYGLGYSKLNLFGQEFDFKTPVEVANLLFPVVLYFSLRYYQFLRSLHGSYIISTLNGLSDDLLSKLALKTFIKLKKRDGLIVNQGPEWDEATETGIIRNAPPYEVRVRGYVSTKENPNNHRSLEDKIKLNKWDEFRVSFCRWRRLIVNTPMFTEFILPLIVSALAVLFHILKIYNLI